MGMFPANCVSSNPNTRGHVYVCEHFISTFKTPSSANSYNIFYTLLQQIAQKSSCC